MVIILVVDTLGSDYVTTAVGISVVNAVRGRSMLELISVGNLIATDVNGSAISRVVKYSTASSVTSVAPT